jgi:hypothetical protein
MRATDNRYRREQTRFSLAVRLIEHEARTGTIRYLTGLQDERIRKIYTTYFKYGSEPVRRRRGRSPTRIGPLVRTPLRALESGVFVNLLLASGLFSVDQPPGPSLKANVELGHRLCDCFGSFELLVPHHSLSFEWGWNLLKSIRRGDELGVARCQTCQVCYVFDLLTLPRTACPTCVLCGELPSVPFELMSA